jgi:hypothetical protein
MGGTNLKYNLLNECGMASKETDGEGGVSYNPREVGGFKSEDWILCWGLHQ